MKNRLFPPFLLVSLLTACAPLHPDIPLPEVPSGPMLRSLDRHREAFSSLKAVARVETERRGRKRTYESVAVILKGQDLLRVEAFGPMGEQLFAAVWDGKDVLVRTSADPEVHRTGPGGFERLLGMAVMPSDLCAVLSGNVPAAQGHTAPRVGCRSDGRCVVELLRPDERWLATMGVSASGNGDPLFLESAELYRGGGLVFRSMFSYANAHDAYRFPKRVQLENPDRKITVIVTYEDAEVNAPVEDNAFLLDGEGGR